MEILKMFIPRKVNVKLFKLHKFLFKFIVLDKVFAFHFIQSVYCSQTEH